MKSLFARLRLLKPLDWAAAWQSFWRGFITVLIFGTVLIAIPGVTPSRSDTHFQALGAARDHLFDFAAWEADAVLDKTSIALIAPARYMSAEEQTQYVRDYIDLVNQIHQLEQQIEQIYIDPSITDPEAASADLRAQRDTLRAQQQAQQALAESIIEGQISEMLSDYGLQAAGQVAPPVAIRFTQLPTIMITSRRDRIERIGSYALEHGLTVDGMETIEDQVDADLDVSSLIVPLGGLAMYPAMLIETGYLPHVYAVGAHEWTHHYLAFFPLGMNYGLTPELYTMNETAASLVGDEIGWALLDRYYPDLAGTPPDYTPHEVIEQQPAPQPADPNIFNFSEQMRLTRIRVDELLALGRVDAAEQYMDARRLVFVRNGYRIRKLNQAYFAFYGSYADQPGATGSDPIGPAMRDLRYYSGSLAEFVRLVRGITSYQDLQRVLAETKAVYMLSTALHKSVPR